MKVPLSGGSVNLGHTLVPSASLTCAATQVDRDGQQGDGLSMDLYRLNQVIATAIAASDGSRIGVIRWPEQAVNFAFGGPDLRTLFCCARTLVYALRVKVPGNSHPWYKRRGQ